MTDTLAIVNRLAIRAREDGITDPEPNCARCRDTGWVRYREPTEQNMRVKRCPEGCLPPKRVPYAKYGPPSEPKTSEVFA